MRILLLPVLFAVLVPPVGADEAAKDLEKLQGAWSASQITYNGKDFNQLKLRFVFKKDVITVEGDDEVKKEYARVGFKLDPSTAPRCFDIRVAAGSQEGAKMEGIYELKGDELKICVKVFGMDRPGEFAAPEGTSIALVVLKREK